MLPILMFSATLNYLLNLGLTGNALYLLANLSKDNSCLNVYGSEIPY